MLRVLVIGGTRFVGYFLTWQLVAAGHQVTLFNRGNTKDPFGTRVTRVVGDRTTSEMVKLLAGRGFDAVADFAGYQPDDVKLAMQALGPGFRGNYVFVSTGQVYLVREGCPVPARESDYRGAVMKEPAGGDDLAQWRYGVGKRGCEDVLASAWEKSRFSSVRLRIPMVNGERDHARRIESYLWRILDGGPVILPDGGLHPCRHVYGADVARVVRELLGRRDLAGRAFNLCQDEQPTLARLVAMLAEALGASPRIVPVASEKIRAAGLDPVALSPFSTPWMSRLDPSLARSQIGFKHTPLASYLERVVSAFLAHPPEDRPPGYERRAEEIALASS